ERGSLLRPPGSRSQSRGFRQCHPRSRAVAARVADLPASRPREAGAGRLHGGEPGARFPVAAAAPAAASPARHVWVGPGFAADLRGYAAGPAG
ncbi:unnamed protein product, partial [Polarella glacialis]